MAGENSVLYQSDSTTIRVIESAINRKEYVSVGVEFVCSVSVINAIIVRLCEMGQNLPQFTSNDSSEIISPTTYTVRERQINISSEVSSLPNNDENIDIASIVNKQLTIPLRRLNPHNISHLTNNHQQDNISNMLPNSPMPIEQVMNDVDRQIIDVAVDNYHTTTNPNANNRLIIPADYISSQRVIEEESNTSRPSTIPTIPSTEAIAENLWNMQDDTTAVSSISSEVSNEDHQPQNVVTRSRSRSSRRKSIPKKRL